MRSSVQQLAALGTLPAEGSASAADLQKVEELLNSIDPPLTNAEAIALMSVFGQDACFGLTWSLVHLIETAPDWPIEASLREASGEWIRLLCERAGVDLS
jgi:hypothetical protein